MEKEEILFKNVTKMEKQDYEIFSRFWLTKYKRYNYITKVIVCLIFLFLGVYSPIYQIATYGTINSVLLFRLYTHLCVFIVLIMPKGTINEKQNIENNYEFTDSKIIIRTNTYNTQEIIYEKYNPIYRVCETEKYIYFMTLNNSAYILNKDEFIVGKREDFSKYIKEKYKEKYIDFNDSKNKKQFKNLYNKSEVITTALFYAVINIGVLIGISAIFNM